MENSSKKSGKRKISKWPPGFKLRRTLRDHTGWISQIAWSPDGRMLASGSDDNTIRLWDIENEKFLRTLEGHDDTVFSVAWSPDGGTLASGSDDETIILWDVETGKLLNTIKGHTSGVVSVMWLSDGRTLVSGSGDKTIRFWNTETGQQIDILEGHNGWIRKLALSPDGRILASASYDNTIKLWNVDNEQFLDKTLEGHKDGVHSVIWSPDGRTLASASKDFTVKIWDIEIGKLLRTLEGHTAAVYDISFSSDSLFLVSKALDNSIRIWHCETWKEIALLDEESKSTFFGSLAFHPKKSILATLGERDTVIRIWDIDFTTLIDASPATETIYYTSAKIVLVGESNVGKSCLALRLAEDRYEEQGTTHGMRFWEIEPEQLSSDAAAPTGEKRDIVLWDMGGQEEYRLIHQLFLHDTTLALVLLDPTRGRTAFDEVDGWNKRLEKQLHGRKAVKFMVGTKLDDENIAIDRAGLERLKNDCGFIGYYPTSAKTNKGINELRIAISKALDWEMLAKTSRPEIFQRIHDEIERARDEGEVVLLLSDLENRVRKEEIDQVGSKSVNAVVEQLAVQGLIANTQLASGEYAIVTQIDEVERYGGSLIIAARNNPRGVPAIEEQAVASRKMVFPRIKEEKRLPWLQERIVLECVIQLLLEHGICLRHEGLLVFPSLFQVTEKGDEAKIPHSISLYYDFTGAIDNIYSSLVARLAISERFGRYRLWENRAEFEIVGQEACGLHKVTYRSGVAHLDIYFADNISNETRDLFMVFIEDHLRNEGVEIAERIEITCACGYRFQEVSIRKRLVNGFGDIICPECEKRSRISEGARRARYSDPKMEKKLIALKTIIDKKCKNDVDKAIKRVSQSTERKVNIIRILHLSDFHMKLDSDPQTMLQQLIADLKDRSGGLGFEWLDYLVISGDLSNYASPKEFEKARQIISGLIEEFQLTAERCIIVPGNHDLDWEESVYEGKHLRQVDLKSLKDGTYVKQGEAILIRNDDRYPLRFKNFSEKFYHPLIQKEYPRTYEKQCIPFLFADTKIQFLAINSCWEIDPFHPSRSSIFPPALSHGLLEADEQIKQEGLSVENEQVLRIAVWHHPVTGNEKINDDAFIERLRKSHFKLCLHGHVHEERTDLIGYLHPTRKIYVAGAGSFGAPMYDRPESIPRLYNVIEVTRDHSSIKVHTRCLRKDEGAWEGWAVWQGQTPDERRTYYKIKLTKQEIGFNSIYGDRDVIFSRELAKMALVPMPALSLKDVKLSHVNTKLVSVHTSALNYFNNIEMLNNRIFMQKVQWRYRIQNYKPTLALAATKSQTSFAPNNAVPPES